MHQVDTAIVGGGASGMMAALALASKRETQTRPVMLLEGADRVGKKLLATGNGRCNLTNLQMTPSHYHGERAEIAKVLEAYPTKRVLSFFEDLGLLCRPDAEGRVYPYAGQASAVSDVLRRGLEAFGVETISANPVSRIRKRSSGGFILDGPEPVTAKKVILACGGMAAPQFGCAVGGYALAQSLGHTVTPLRPALAPVTVRPDEVRALKGIRCRAKVTLYRGDTPLKSEVGELQFGDGVLSGICMFQLSRFVGKKASPGTSILVDLLPDYEEAEVRAFLAEKQRRFGEKQLPVLLEGMLHKRAAQEALKRAGLFPDGRDLSACAHAVKAFRFTATGTAGFRQAQVTAGGVPLREVFSQTMESRICRNLFLTGELLDPDGDCGGYNLHWAWSTGMAARFCSRKIVGINRESRKNMIRISELAMPLDSTTEDLKRAAAKRLGVSASELANFRIARKSVDARKKQDVHFVYTVLAELGKKEGELLKKRGGPKLCAEKPLSYRVPEKKKPAQPPVVAGFGPAGMFAALLLAQAGLCPIVFERGAPVEARQASVAAFRNGGAFSPDANIQGEGGAGTFGRKADNRHT